MVKYLKTAKGEKLPVKLSYVALKKFQQKTGKSLLNGNTADLQFEDFETLLFYALKQGFKVEELEFKYTEADMEDLMDDVFMDFIKLIPFFFAKDETPAEATEEVKN